MVRANQNNNNNNINKGNLYSRWKTNKEKESFSVQIASYSSWESAVKALDNNKKMADSLGQYILIYYSNIESNTPYKLVIGNLKNREEAENIKSKLQNNFNRGSITIAF
jgi:cell division septation protein DedD